MNALYVRRRLRVIVPPRCGMTPDTVLAAMQKNLESLGFLLAPEVCNALRKLDLARLEAFYRDLVRALQEMVGAHRQFRPMYPNFPEQVMEMPESRLYWNAFVHYCTNRLLPYEKRERTPLFEATQPKLIQLGSTEDFQEIFGLLVSARSSLSAEDKKDLTWFVAQYREDIRWRLPEAMTNKENLAVLGAALLRYTSFGAAWLEKRVQTPTDVLRIAVALSDGDVSLAAPTKFGKFSRSLRRLLLSWVERSASPTEDLLRWKARWIRLGERLHPGEFADRYPRTCAAFSVLRKDQPFETFNGAIERHLATGDAMAAVALLQTRPGDFARRLDHALRSSQEPSGVIASFSAVVERVSTAVLLQVMTHFRHRQARTDRRIFFPKGEVGKVQSVPNKLPALPQEMTQAVAKVCDEILVRRFATRPPLGKCYLDPQLSAYVAPFSQRSASKALRTVARGSRLPLPETRILRMFVWWRNGRARTDIDLSTALYNEKLEFLDLVSYYNLATYGGCHSGDIVDAPQGAAEFIDLDLDLVRERGARYIVMSLHSFTNQPYCDLPECFAGWMARQRANSGEIFEPRTVQDKVDIAADTRVCLPAFFDLVEEKVIWADLALKSHAHFNNVHGNLGGISLMLRSLLELRKTDLHTLFDLHIRARGTAVASRAEAETIFATDEGITPFDVDKIVADYL